jgi:hypothetical protein
MCVHVNGGVAYLCVCVSIYICRRFPFNKPLRAWLMGYMDRNVPTESWLDLHTHTLDYASAPNRHTATAHTAAHSHVDPGFTAIRASLLAAVVDQWTSELAHTHTQPALMGVCQAWPFFVWAIEEYMQCVYLYENGRFDSVADAAVVADEKSDADTHTHISKRRKTSDTHTNTPTLRLPIHFFPRAHALRISGPAWAHIMAEKGLALAEKGTHAHTAFQPVGETRSCEPVFRVVVPLLLSSSD